MAPGKHKGTKALGSPHVGLAAYERKYPRSLFNKGVRSQDKEHLGHVMKETPDKIVVGGGTTTGDLTFPSRL